MVGTGERTRDAYGSIALAGIRFRLDSSSEFARRVSARDRPVRSVVLQYLRNRSDVHGSASSLAAGGGMARAGRRRLWSHDGRRAKLRRVRRLHGWNGVFVVVGFGRAAAIRLE